MGVESGRLVPAAAVAPRAPQWRPTRPYRTPEDRHEAAPPPRVLRARDRAAPGPVGSVRPGDQAPPRPRGLRPLEPHPGLPAFRRRGLAALRAFPRGWRRIARRASRAGAVGSG